VFHFCTITERKVPNKAKCDERRQRDAITKCFSFAKILEIVSFVNPLNAELNPICHLLALLGAHHIIHISRMRVKPPSWQSWFFKREKMLQYRLGAVLPNVVMPWLTSEIYWHNSYLYAN
jgi:hypothetical protein